MKKGLIFALICLLIFSCVSCTTATPHYGEIDLTAEEELRIQEEIQGAWINDDKTSVVEFKILNAEENITSGQCTYETFDKAGTLRSSHSFAYQIKENILSLVSIDEGTQSDIIYRFSVSINKDGNILSLTDENNKTIHLSKAEDGAAEIIKL